jgi:hypothetical protein
MIKEPSRRCVREVPFGFALYLRCGLCGIHMGVADLDNAKRWLDGYPAFAYKVYPVPEHIDRSEFIVEINV